MLVAVLSFLIDVIVIASIFYEYAVTVNKGVVLAILL